MTSSRKVKVTASFPPDFFDGLTQPPLVMRPGEALEVVEEAKSERWPAFVLVVNRAGGRGWVPERHLKRQGRAAVAIEPYEATGANRVPGMIERVVYHGASEQLVVRLATGDGVPAGARLVESLRVIQLAVSLGGVESIIQHPASMTHGTLPEEEIRKAGIEPGLLRLSIGLEDVEDLRRDLAQGLDAAGC